MNQDQQLTTASKNTERLLFEIYGPLLTLRQTADLLHRTPDGLRVSLGRDTEFSKLLNPARRKIGRRVYFRTSALARLIEEDVL